MKITLFYIALAIIGGMIAGFWGAIGLPVAITLIAIAID